MSDIYQRFGTLKGDITPHHRCEISKSTSTGNTPYAPDQRSAKREAQNASDMVDVA